MSLLGTDPRVAFDRFYPFENRYLTYLAKASVVLERLDVAASIPYERLHFFDNSSFGPRPWSSSVEDGTEALGLPLSRDFLRSFWSMFSVHVSQRVPGAAFYAEKTPAWIAYLLPDCIFPFTLYLFRDPRDVYISANAFIRKRLSYGLARGETDTDLDHARNLTHSFVSFFENYLMDNRRDNRMLVRYEDMLERREELPSRLQRVLSLNTHWDSDSRWTEVHQTALDLPSSVNRWRREPIPDDVKTYFETHLLSEMSYLNYSVDATHKDRFARSVEFRLGAINLGLVQQSDDGQIKLKKDAADVTITGADFWFILPITTFEASVVQEIWISLMGDVGEMCSVYWCGAGQVFSEERSIHIRYWPAIHWQVLRFKVGLQPLWKGDITGLRVDLFNCSYPTVPGIGSVRWVRLVS